MSFIKYIINLTCIILRGVRINEIPTSMRYVDMRYVSMSYSSHHICGIPALQINKDGKASLWLTNESRNTYHTLS